MDKFRHLGGDREGVFLVSQGNGSILIVDDDKDILVAGRLLLKRHFSHVETVDKPARIPALMAAHPFDAILLDMNYSGSAHSGKEGFDWLSRILEIDADAVVILITAYGNVELAVEAIKRGATDFISKPWQNEKLVATITAAVRLRRTRQEARALRRQNRELVAETTRKGDSLLGKSAEIAEVQRLISRAAPTEANVLVLGENGTGKELVAREIHRQSNRAASAFMAVDLGALPESLFESELFGHRRGAFTGAREDRIGRFQAASGGTLFLDEIGNIPLHLQAKLLGALELRHVTPVGDDKPVAVDVRVISATNVARDRMGDGSRFRQDLLYRLNTVEITLPPLRQRHRDIPLLIDHFLSYYARKYDRPRKALSDAAHKALCGYAWPGNVRALRHAAERAIILGDGAVLEATDFSLPAADATATGAPSAVSSTPGDFGAMTLDEIERQVIAASLRRHQGNVSQAARQLGLTRGSLYRRMEKHGL